MTLNEVMQELESYGDANTKKTLMKHGAQEPFFGVKVQDLKKILKKTKKNHELSLELYATGNSDAMYLAGLMADETKISKAELNNWADKAYWYYLSEFAVPWVAAETPFAMELGLEWIESNEERIASAGWAALIFYAGYAADEEIDKERFTQLLHRVEKEVHTAPNRVRYAMNGFVIAVGSYIPSLTKIAQEVASTIGKVSVEMGGTACKVPLATEYLIKAIYRDKIGVKRKSARC